MNLEIMPQETSITIAKETFDGDLPRPPLRRTKEEREEKSFDRRPEVHEEICGEDDIYPTEESSSQI